MCDLGFFGGRGGDRIFSRKGNFQASLVECRYSNYSPSLSNSLKNELVFVCLWLLFVKSICHSLCVGNKT